MPFLNLEWTSNRIQFFGEVDLFSVLSGLLYRNEWSSISGILISTTLHFLINPNLLHPHYIITLHLHSITCIFPLSSIENHFQDILS